MTTTYRNTVVPCLPFLIKLEYWYWCCHNTCNEKFTAPSQDTHFFDLQKRPPKENKKCDSFFPLDFVSQPDSEKENWNCQFSPAQFKRLKQDKKHPMKQCPILLITIDKQRRINSWAFGMATHWNYIQIQIETNLNFQKGQK